MASDKDSPSVGNTSLQASPAPAPTPSSVHGTQRCEALVVDRAHEQDVADASQDGPDGQMRPLPHSPSVWGP